MKVDVAGAEVDGLIQGNCSYPKSTSLVTEFSYHTSVQHTTTLLNSKDSISDIVVIQLNTLKNFQRLDNARSTCSTSKSIFKITS